LTEEKKVLTKKELKKAYEAGLIDEQKFKEELFLIETTKPKQRQKKKLPVALTEDEFGNLIRNTKKDRFKLAFLFGFGAGMRLSEILGGVRENGEIMPPLTADKIDMQRKTIYIKDAKGGKDRIVPVPKGLKIEHIKLLPLNQGYSNIKSARRAFEIAFKVAAERAGLLKIKPGLHFHSLRHSFGTLLANSGMPIHHIRTLMGHSNISTTNIYLEANPKDALKSYEELF